MTTGLLLAQRYELTTRLGGGGMGSVWLARDLTLNADVAIKLIHPEHIGSPEAVARFRREAQSAAAIRSTHVIQILDYGVESGTPYIAMERLAGESLSQRLKRLGTFSPAQTEHVLGQVAQALALAHERGIVHRDVKPDNIFLVREGDEEVCKVLDFGIAHHPGDASEFDAFKTQTGAILGTPYYMSPEQATGQTVDCLTDIWSFGVIALECLIGRRPFRSDSLGVLFHAICVAPLPVPSRLGPVPAGFDAWFACAAARDKAARFQSIQAAAQELRAICGRASGEGFSPAIAAVPAGNVAMARTQSGTFRSGSAGSAIFPAFQYTARSATPEGARRKAGIKAALWITLPAAAVLAIALHYVQGWNRNADATAGNQVPSNAHVDDYVAPTVIAATDPKTAPIELADAGTAPGTVEHRSSLETRPVTAPRHRPTRVPTKAPPVPNPIRPSISGHARDDNVAGI